MDQEKIKNTIEEILKRMNVSFNGIEISADEAASSPRFLIKTNDSAILIGIKGANLLALNHIVKKIINRGIKEVGDDSRFFIDVNNYQTKLEEELRNRAKIMCERARSFRVDIELDPMSSYERMIIHSCLQKEPDIKTESKGEGRDRRVVIKYVETGNL